MVAGYGYAMNDLHFDPINPTYPDRRHRSGEERRALTELKKVAEVGGFKANKTRRALVDWVISYTVDGRNPANQLIW